MFQTLYLRTGFPLQCSVTTLPSQVLSSGYWQGSFDGISANGETVIRSKGIIIDTGATLVASNTQSIVRVVYCQITGSQYVGNGTGSSTFMTKLSR